MLGNDMGAILGRIQDDQIKHAEIGSDLDDRDRDGQLKRIRNEIRTMFLQQFSPVLRDRLVRIQILSRITDARYQVAVRHTFDVEQQIANLGLGHAGISWLKVTRVS